MDIGENLKEIMEERQIKIKQLAELTGISQSHLFNVIKGTASLSIENLIKVANALNASADRVLGLKDYRPRRIIDVSDLTEANIETIKLLVESLRKGQK